MHVQKLSEKRWSEVLSINYLPTFGEWPNSNSSGCSSYFVLVVICYLSLILTLDVVKNNSLCTPLLRLTVLKTDSVHVECVTIFFTNVSVVKFSLLPQLTFQTHKKVQAVSVGMGFKSNFDLLRAYSHSHMVNSSAIMCHRISFGSSFCHSLFSDFGLSLFSDSNDEEPAVIYRLFGMTSV